MLHSALYIVISSTGETIPFTPQLGNIWMPIYPLKFKYKRRIIDAQDLGIAQNLTRYACIIFTLFKAFHPLELSNSNFLLALFAHYQVFYGAELRK